MVITDPLRNISSGDQVEGVYSTEEVSQTRPLGILLEEGSVKLSVELRKYRRPLMKCFCPRAEGTDPRVANEQRQFDVILHRSSPGTAHEVEHTGFLCSWSGLGSSSSCLWAKQPN